jgi:hypothetical protein
MSALIWCVLDTDKLSCSLTLLAAPLAALAIAPKADTAICTCGR